MCRRLFVILILTISAHSAIAQQAAPSGDDVARRAIDVLAGAEWERARYIAFTFTVVRDGKVAVALPQKYDRFTGDYRVSGKDQAGDTFDIVMNVNTKQGRARKNGAAVADPQEMLTRGYRRFINDTYWLLMPLKSMDPGVKREYAGEKTDACGDVFDVVHLSFESVGLTPGDNYWMWVNRSTGLVEQWHMKLEGSKPEDEPSVVEFRDYRRFGGLLFSTKRQIRGKEQMIRLDDITVSKDVPAGAFNF